jgi:S-formylglutathione hydrolase FrmB
MLSLSNPQIFSGIKFHHMKKNLSLFFLLFIAIRLNASTVDTVSVYSSAMRKSLKCIVITPESDKDSIKRFPVVYLLHGYGGDYSNWIMKVPQLKKYADEYQLMIVCPDGHYSSWYFDSPIDSTMRYETYISKEVPAFIDKNYPTIKDRAARGITGLSMGGHGGLFLGFRHADIFAACGSMSGGVDINASRNRFDVSKRIGDTTRYADNWSKYSVINVIEKKPADSLAVIVDCGTEDFFYSINHALHEKMLKLKIPHDYIERPGQHNWLYWSNAVQYQLLFFRNQFARAKR